MRGLENIQWEARISNFDIPGPLERKALLTGTITGDILALR
jgi:hypothetical protein